MATMPTTVTNFATNPRPLTVLDSGAGGWEYMAGVGEAGSSSVMPDEGALGLPGFARRVITTAKTSGSGGWRYSEDASGAAGSARDVRMYVRHSSAISVRVRVEFLLGGVGAGSFDSDPVAVPAGVFTAVDGYGASSGPFDQVRAWAFVSGALPTGTFDAACALVMIGELEPLTEPYPSAFLFPSETLFPL